MSANHAVLVCLFGAPHGYENNLTRAVEFLLALRQREAENSWKAGLSYGMIYGGIMGGKERQEYTAIGDVVNFSAPISSLEMITG